MKVTFLTICLFCYGFSFHTSPVQAQHPSIYAKNVIFRFYDEVGEIYEENTIRDAEQFRSHVRENRNKVAIIVHGWREGCKSDWIPMLVHNMNEFRGGTIICMDYSFFAMEENYFRLVKHFDALSDVLTVKLQDLETSGYRPDDMHLFGFSFGGQLVVEAGKRFGVRRIKSIDACDMAGPGFDNKPTTDHRLAAQNVQCIHTSRDKGTRFSLCNQNWKMGNCGISQDAASRPPYGSHGLCPYFYNLAFHHPFYAVSRPRQCRAKNEASRWPKKFRMGYLGEDKELVQGELFALTSKNFPFNVIPKGPERTTYRLNSTELENSFDLKFDGFLPGFTRDDDDYEEGLYEV